MIKKGDGTCTVTIRGYLGQEWEFDAKTDMLDYGENLGVSKMHLCRVGMIVKTCRRSALAIQRAPRAQSAQRASITVTGPSSGNTDVGDTTNNENLTVRTTEYGDSVGEATVDGTETLRACSPLEKFLVELKS